MGNGFVQPPCLGQGNPEVDMRLRVLGIDLQGLFEVHDRLGELSCPGQESPQVDANLSILRIDFQKYLEANPDSAEAHNNLGRALAEKGRLTEAIAHFRKAILLKPDYLEVHLSLGAVLAWQEKSDEAMVHFAKVLEINPDIAEAHYYLGVALYHSQGKTAEALAHWRRALRIEPNHVPALNQTARVLATSPETSVRNGAEAVGLAERAVHLSGGRDPETLDTLAAAYAEAGRFSEAVEAARRALALAAQLNNKPLAEALTARIALYEAKAPLRETWPASASAARP
jgi:tetratricopeptide (TPR) repeat protein